MAFENVFGNIDFQAGNKSARADQQQMMQQVGMALGQYNQGKERDLRERQLGQQQEAAQAKQAGNFKQIAMEELNRINQGGSPTEQGQAAIQVMQQTTSDQIYPDAITGQMVRKPSAWDAIGMSGQQQPNYGAAQPAGVNTLFPPQNAMANAMGIPQLPAEAVGGLPPEPSLPQNTQDGFTPTELPAFMKGTRGGELKQYEEQVKDVSGARKDMRDMEKKFKEAKRPEFEPMEGFTPSADDTKSMTKITVSKNMLDGLIDDYTAAIGQKGAYVSGTKRAKSIDRVAGKIRMQVKNLEELGALQEPDIKAMDEMLGSAVLTAGDAINPISGYTQIREGGNIAVQSMKEFKEYVNDTQRTQAKARGFKIKGEKSKPQAQDIETELRRRGLIK
jgi:hypothetical protein